MNIACDARALVGPRTGVGAWTVGVMAGLAATPGWSVTLAASRRIDVPPELDLPSVTTLPPPRAPVPGTLWLNSVLPRRLAAAGADLFVATLAVIPRRCPVPAVAVVHDLTPRTHPDRHTVANRFCFNAYVEESLERAAAVAAVSSSTAAELEATFPRLAGHVHAIPNGVDAFFTAAPAGDDGTAVRASWSGGRPYILHLGTLEPRKGIADLVAAWDLLHDLTPTPPDLVLAGAPGWGLAPIEASIETSPHRERIHRLGYVTREAARDLLRHAELFVLASEAEGYGLPLAEALCCGTPAVASDAPALVETAGGAALHARRANPEALATAIAHALEPATAADLRRRAAERAPDLRWPASVAAWRELFLEVAGR